MSIFISSAEQAFVTLATNDSYARGAMVLGKSLRNHKTSKKLVVLVGPHVSDQSRYSMLNSASIVLQTDFCGTQNEMFLNVLGRFFIRSSMKSG